ncbi:MAG: S8 family serine peptidase [Candidatus Eisenbacteria bacterium]
MHIVRSWRSVLALALAATSGTAHAVSSGPEGPEAQDGVSRRLDPLLRYELEAARTRGDDAPIFEALSSSPAGDTKIDGSLSVTPYVPAPWTGSARGASENHDGYIACWVRIEPGTELPSGLSLELYGDRIASGRLRISEIEQLVEVDGVLAIEAARRTRPSLDLSVPEIGASDVHAGTASPSLPAGKMGTNAVVGIVDTGIDITHGDFLADNATRIVALWDQTAASTHPPDVFGYGREWTPAEIDAGSCTEADADGHGTHVAGTAAGSGHATGNGQAAGRFVGVAPEARIVVVKTDFYTSSIVDAIDYVFAKADELNLPAVVNLSLGHHYGPHDGTEATDLAMDALVGPGRIIVAAAGNEQEDGIHAEASVPRGGTEEIRLTVPSYTPHAGLGNDLILVDGYYDEAATLALTLITPSGQLVGPVTPAQTVELPTSDGAVRIENDVFDATTADHNLHIQIWDLRTGESPEAGTWRIQLENTSPAGVAENAQADFWIYYQSLSSSDPPTFDSAWGMTAEKLVASPASADSVIAVAAYVTRTSWQSVDGSTYSYNPAPALGDIAPFSCRGPRRDGALKPDVAAPGVGIGAALSADHRTSSAWVLPDGVHYIMQGTSMAAPHVTGVVALMLDTHGFLSQEEVLSRLSSSARADALTGDVPNTAFGAGKVDAIAALTGPIPVALLGLEASREEDGVHLLWSVSESLSDLTFEVERATVTSTAGDETDRTLVGVTGPGPHYEFIDGDAPSEQDLAYWLTSTQYGQVVQGPFYVSRETLPAGLELSAPWPNPFSGDVRWTLSLPAPADVSLDVIDAAGRRVTELHDGPLPAGTSSLSWDGRGATGVRLGSGVYWLRARWNGTAKTERLVLVR